MPGPGFTPLGEIRNQANQGADPPDTLACRRRVRKNRNVLRMFRAQRRSWSVLRIRPLPASTSISCLPLLSPATTMSNE